MDEVFAVAGSCTVLWLGVTYARFLYNSYLFIKENDH